MNEKIKNYINKEYLSNKKIFIISTVLFIINYLIKHFFTENKVISDNIGYILITISVTALFLMTYNVLTLRAIKKIEDGKDV